jgi:DNA-binding response OmpR family regulator
MDRNRHDFSEAVGALQPRHDVDATGDRHDGKDTMAHLRRSGGVICGALTIDPERRRVLVGARAVALTPLEFDLLLYLARRPDAVLRREQLLTAVWGYRHAGYARTVDSHVTRVRKKLVAAGLRFDVLRTVHGIGYAFDATGTTLESP